MSRLVLAMALVAMALSAPAAEPKAHAPQSKFAEVNGVRLHYLVAGKGDAVILLRGYAQNSHMPRRSRSQF